jgi:hypothetical protein
LRREARALTFTAGLMPPTEKQDSGYIPLFCVAVTAAVAANGPWVIII